MFHDFSSKERNGANRDHEPTKAERRLQQALALYNWLHAAQDEMWRTGDMVTYARLDKARRDMWQVVVWWEEAVDAEQGAMRWSGYFKPAA